jgi:hypothetical protein
LGLRQPTTAVEMGKGEAQLGRSTGPGTPPPSQGKPSLEPGDPGVLPIIRIGTPPPTPDSSIYGAAEARVDSGDEKIIDKAEHCPAVPESDDARTGETPQPKADAVDMIRHTRQERIWLHVNYRGEGPFLKAWALDITKVADRIEGLAIVRELIQAEEEGKRVEGL